jgi:hypothetical protein
MHARVHAFNKDSVHFVEILDQHANNLSFIWLNWCLNSRATRNATHFSIVWIQSRFQVYKKAVKETESVKNNLCEDLPLQ